MNVLIPTRKIFKAILFFILFFVFFPKNYAQSSQLAKADIPWHLGSTNIQAHSPAAIDTILLSNIGKPIVVAVIDTGIFSAHPSLRGQLIGGYDFISSPNNLRGDRSPNFEPDAKNVNCQNRVISSVLRTHGTEVASLIAGNGIGGVWGVNPAAKVLPIRVFGACPMSRLDLIDAISWAAGLPTKGMPVNANPAQIINMSLSGGNDTCSPELQQLITKLVGRGVFIVAAAGNNFHKPLKEPANCKNVISVGAIDSENNIATYSSLDERTVIYAPGGGKRLSGDEEWKVNKLKVATLDIDFFGHEVFIEDFRGVGTSYSAPLISGFISLWLSRYPNKTSSDFIQELPQFVRDVSPILSCPACNPKGLTASNFQASSE